MKIQQSSEGCAEGVTTHGKDVWHKSSQIQTIDQTKNVKTSD